MLTVLLFLIGILLVLVVGAAVVAAVVWIGWLLLEIVLHIFDEFDI